MTTVLFRMLRFAVTPSWPALAGAITSILLIVSALALLTNERLDAMLGAYPGYQHLDPNRAHLFHGMVGLPHKRAQSDKLVVFVGGSTTRESIWSEDFIARLMEARLGETVSIVDATSSAQRLSTSLVLARAGACAGADIVVIGANLGRMSTNIPFDNLAYFGFGATRQGEETGVADRSDMVLSWAKFRVDMMSQVVAHAVEHALPGKPAPSPRAGRHLYLHRDLPDPDRRLESYREAVSVHLRHDDRSYLVLQQIIEAVLACGAVPVMMITPLAPPLADGMAFPDYAQADARHLQRLKTAAPDSAHLLDVNARVTYRVEDFYDWGHLRLESAIRATSTAIADRLAEIIERKR